VEYVPDRRANDLRYSMTCEKVTALGWVPQRAFAEALTQTVEWYRDNPGRWAPLLRNRQAPLPRISLAALSEAAS
jgi:dTDP-glucose 4,6-dehydratase